MYAMNRTEIMMMACGMAFGLHHCIIIIMLHSLEKGEDQGDR